MQEKVFRLIDDLKNCADYKSAITCLVGFKEKNSGVKYIEKTGAYIAENYYILPSFTSKSTEFLTNLETNLTKIKQFNCCLTSAPELVEIVETLDKKFSVIVYKLKDTQTAELVPYTQSEGATEEKKALFRAEQLELLDKTGLYNPEIFNSLLHFYLTKDTGNIVFEAWGTLEVCEDSKKQLIAEKIKTLL